MGMRRCAPQTRAVKRTVHEFDTFFISQLSFPASPRLSLTVAEMDTGEESAGDSETRLFWDQFQQLAQLMRALGLLECFTAHAAAVVVQEKVILEHT